MIELLSPAGNLDCVKAAVQNGASAVYLGAESFSARAFANNFTLEELQMAIKYCKIRNVKVNLALNTLITDSEFEKALTIAKNAYESGIDAIIVQDLGLGKKLLELFPKLPIHASTQMSIHTLNGVLKLEQLGFKRVVLARELSMSDIRYITKNSNAEIECFAHGALCVSYSGQCLISSMIGARSANRGKCAQSCRMNFNLLEDNSKIDSGYLLSLKDLCTLDFIPDYIAAGVKCLKLEGRMKSPEYVATITKIYRKYVDLAYSDKPYVVEEADRKELLQAFNRGMFSTGHLSSKPNLDLVSKDKPNNMGLYLGIISKYSENKGHITLKLNEEVSIGDTISIGNEPGSYTISELMNNNRNITSTNIGDIITIGRMKGNIQQGDKIYKISSKKLLLEARESYSKEYKKINLNCNIVIKKDTPISIEIQSAESHLLYDHLNIKVELDVIPEIAINKPLDKESIIKQISKTNNTPFNFSNINIDLDENIFIPKLSLLNDLRRKGLESVEDFMYSKIIRTLPMETTNKIKNNTNNITTIDSVDTTNNKPKLSVLLNMLDLNYDYSKLTGFDNLYIPLKYFTGKQYKDILLDLSKRFNLYIYMPTIIKENYRNLFSAYTAGIHENKYNIKGFVISNICNIKLLGDISEKILTDLDIVANFTFNAYNTSTIEHLKDALCSRFTLSPELNTQTINVLLNSNIIPGELIVYGKAPVMNINYCLLGESNKCYPTCEARCTNNHKYFISDRLNMKFRILPDNVQTITTIYNSKITSLNPSAFNANSFRIDILDESIEEINNIIEIVKSGKRLEGLEYTNGNLNRDI